MYLAPCPSPGSKTLGRVTINNPITRVVTEQGRGSWCLESRESFGNSAAGGKLALPTAGPGDEAAQGTGDRDICSAARDLWGGRLSLPQAGMARAKSSSPSQPRCPSKMGQSPLPPLPLAQLLVVCSSLEPGGFHPWELPELCLYPLGHPPSSFLLSYHRCHFLN